jgi:anti-sigma factor ChrR (cupin superfamily)
MRINDDLTQPVFVRAAKLDWIPSPAAGVDRRMLFRIGDEVARATSIVRYAPGSAFPRHTHSGGEEIVVLEGTFQDEHGNYPAGSYFRNPPGTSHIPASEDGCTIFVRLWQFRAGDQVQIVRLPGEGDKAVPRKGATTAIVLFDDGREKVSLEDWAADEAVTVENMRGLEFLVLSGEIVVGEAKLEPQGWGRLPAGMALNATVGPQGARIWIKEGSLLHPDVCQLPV